MSDDEGAGQGWLIWAGEKSFRESARAEVFYRTVGKMEEDLKSSVVDIEEVREVFDRLLK